MIRPVCEIPGGRRFSSDWSFLLFILRQVEDPECRRSCSADNRGLQIILSLDIGSQMSKPPVIVAVRWCWRWMFGKEGCCLPPAQLLLLAEGNLDLSALTKHSRPNSSNNDHIEKSK